MKNDELKNQIVIYETPDGKQRVDVRFENETAWLSQKRIAELFEVDRSVITKHLGNIFSTGELEEKAVCANFAHTAEDGKTYKTQFYNLDTIISIGYRVNSANATQFRIWATQRLREYIIKGFVLDDVRLKQGGHKSRYFEELLEKIRDIRSSAIFTLQRIISI